MKEKHLIEQEIKVLETAISKAHENIIEAENTVKTLKWVLKEGD